MFKTCQNVQMLGGCSKSYLAMVDACDKLIDKLEDIFGIKRREKRLKHGWEKVERANVKRDLNNLSKNVY